MDTPESVTNVTSTEGDGSEKTAIFIGVAVGVTITAIVFISIVVLLVLILCTKQAKGEHEVNGNRRSLLNKFRSTKRGELFHHPIFISQRDNLFSENDRPQRENTSRNIQNNVGMKKVAKADTSNVINSKEDEDSSVEKRRQKKNNDRKEKSTSMPCTREKPDDTKKKTNSLDVPRREEAKKFQLWTKPAEKKSSIPEKEHGQAYRKSVAIETIQSPETPDLKTTNKIGLTANASYGSIPNPRPLSTPNLMGGLLARANLPTGTEDGTAVPYHIPTDRNPSYLQVSQSSDQEINEDDPEESGGDYSYVKSDTFASKKTPEQVGIYVDLDSENSTNNHDGIPLSRISDGEENFYL